MSLLCGLITGGLEGHYTGRQARLSSSPVEWSGVVLLQVYDPTGLHQWVCMVETDIYKLLIFTIDH